jgi:hypothetical protein
MAERTPQTVTGLGLDAAAYAASGGGDSVPTDCIVRAINDGGSPVTMTVTTHGVVDTDLAIEDRAISIPAGEARYFKATGAVYRNPATGRVDLTWSGTTDVTFEVIK